MATRPSLADPDTLRRYSSGAIAFHWIIAGLMIVNVALGALHESVESLPLMSWHKPIGLVILVLSLGRWAWRLTHRPPPQPPMPGWQKGLSHAVHWLFYLLIVAMPLSGWWFSSAGEKRWPIDFFGLFPIPFLPVARGTATADALHQFHVIFGWALIPLILLHAGAAWYHHLIRRDRTLVRIAPFLVSEPAEA